MKRIQIIYTVLGLLINFNISAQKLPESSQYIINPFLLSSSYAGLNDDFEAFLGYKKYWMDIENSPVDKIFSVNSIMFKNIGIGGTIISSNTDVYTNLYISLAYSYHLKLNENHNLSFGLNGSVFENSLDLSGIKISHQEDPVIEYYRQSGSWTMFNAGTSVLYRFKKIEAGFVLPFLINNKTAYSNENNKNDLFLRRQYNFHLSYDFKINDNWGLEPFIISRYIYSSPVSIDLTLVGKYKEKYWLAFTYRHSGSIYWHAGLDMTQRLKFNYTYEMAWEGIASYSSGSHEFGLGIILNKISKQAKEDFRFDDSNSMSYNLTDTVSTDLVVIDKSSEVKNYENSLAEKGSNKSESTTLLESSLLKLYHDLVEYQGDNPRMIASFQDRLNTINAEYKIIAGELPKERSISIRKSISNEQILIDKLRERSLSNNVLEKEVVNVVLPGSKGSEYFMIAESFRILNNAKTSVKNLESRGIGSYIIYDQNREWYYVSVGSDNKYWPAKQKLAPFKTLISSEMWLLQGDLIQ